MADKKISALSSASTPLAGTEVLPIVQSSATVKVSVANLTAGRTPSMNGALIGATASAISGYNLVNYGNAFFAGTPIATNGALLTFRDASATGSNTTLGGVQFTSSPGNDYFIGKASVNANGFLDIGNANTGATYFRVDNTGNMAVRTAAKGINFTANTPAAGMTSQLLNWYEEGTWTPSFTNFGTTNVLFAKYTRIGRAVTINMRFECTTATANSSYFTLPFNSAEITSGTWTRSTLEGGFVEVQSGAICNFASTPSSTSGAFAVSVTYFV